MSRLGSSSAGAGGGAPSRNEIGRFVADEDLRGGVAVCAPLVGPVAAVVPLPLEPADLLVGLLGAQQNKEQEVLRGL